MLDIRLKQENCECIECDYVIDLDEQGLSIGVEYIDYQGFLDGANLNDIRDAFESKVIRRLTFDEDNGCIYVKIRDGKSVNQRVIKGSICRDKDKNIVAMLIPTA